MRNVLLFYVLSAIPAVIQGEQLVCPTLEDGRPHYTCNYTCQIEDSKLICDYDLPDYWHIPKGTTNIYITHFKRDVLYERNHVFNHTRWQDVRTLAIKCPSIKPGNHLLLNDYDFSSLPLLESLSIHAPELRVIRYNTFVGMVKLSHLDLSGCGNIRRFETLVHALSNVKNRYKLTHLILNEIGNGKPKPIYIDFRFMLMLIARSVVYLSLQRTNMFIQIPCRNISILPLPLETLDISDSIVFGKIEKPCHFEDVRERIYRGFKTIKVLNISRSLASLNLGNYVLNQRVKQICSSSIIIIDMQSIDLSYSLKINPVHLKLIDLSCFRYLTKLYLNSNTLTTVNFSVIWPHKLLYLDLSSNEMTFLAPRTLVGLLNLKSLKLENNLLHQMVSQIYFKNMFRPLLHLESIDLRNNSFNYLSNDIFKGNTRLKFINLKDNKLSSITFNINHLRNLEILDLQNNKITTLDKSAFDNFIFMYEQRKFVIHMHGNCFECVCEHFNFIKWITSRLQNDNSSVYTCILGAYTVPLDKKAVDTTLYLCHRTIIILSISITSGIVIVIASIATLVFCRKRQRQKHNNILKQFFQKLLNGKLVEKYLVFTSFSNDDCDFITKFVQPKLKENLFKKYKIPDQLIVIGDGTFRLGISIFNEIIRCVKSSCVVVFVVSHSFCNSQWCRMELKEAVEQGKPMILLFKEDVNMTDMSDELKTIFDRNTRSKFVQNGDIFEPFGGWTHCCESIVKLSVDKYIRNEQEAAVKRTLKRQEYNKIVNETIF